MGEPEREAIGAHVVSVLDVATTTTRPRAAWAGRLTIVRGRRSVELHVCDWQPAAAWSNGASPAGGSAPRSRSNSELCA